MSILSERNPYISSDYHIGRWILKKHNEEMYAEEIRKTKEVIKMHNSFVGKNSPFLFLGDLHEMEIRESKDIAELYNLVKSLNGNPKIMVKGNNDSFHGVDFYQKLGFQYVSEEPIVLDSLKIIFSHEPKDMVDKGLFNSGWINIHGHIHESKTMYNIPSEGHINVGFMANENKIFRLSEYLLRYDEGKYEYKTEYKAFWT